MILLIGNFLSKHGFNPTAIEGLAIALSKKNKVEISSDKSNPLFRLSHMVTSVIKNRKYCKLIIVDLFSTYALLFAFIVILLAKLLKIPFIPVLRGGSLPEKYKKYPYIFNFLFSSSSIVVCPSKYLQQCFRGKSFQTTIIPNYIDCKNYSFKIRQEIRPHLLWVRAFHEIYNPTMAVLVLNKIINNYPDAHLCMIGPGKDNSINEVRKLINKLKLNNQIKITGKLEKEEWRKLSTEYDIFLNTSNYDNHPVTILEAMALGIPIVTTNVGGIPNLLTHNNTAKLVDPNDVSAMSMCVLDYLSQKEDRIRISSNARDTIEKEFNKIKIIPQWLSMVDGIINFKAN